MGATLQLFFKGAIPEVILQFSVVQRAYEVKDAAELREVVRNVPCFLPGFAVRIDGKNFEVSQKAEIVQMLKNSSNMTSYSIKDYDLGYIGAYAIAKSLKANKLYEMMLS